MQPVQIDHHECKKQLLEQDLQAALCAYLDDYEFAHDLVPTIKKVLTLEHRQRRLEARRIEVVLNELFGSEREVVQYD